MLRPARPVILKPSEVDVTELLRAGEVGRILEVAPVTLLKMRDTGILPHIVIAGVSHYRRGDVERLHAERRRKPPRRGRPVPPPSPLRKAG